MSYTKFSEEKLCFAEIAEMKSEKLRHVVQNAELQMVTEINFVPIAESKLRQIKQYASNAESV